MGKKFVVGLAVVVAVCFAFTAFAAGAGTQEEKITKEKVKESTTTKTGETVTTATAKENVKGAGNLVKEKVVFKSFSDVEGGTITIVKENKEVKMQARHSESWKNNIIGKENKEVTITSSYDPKLMKYVVTHVEPVEKLK